MSLTVPNPDDAVAALLVLAAAGDQAAFAQVYDATSARVYGLVLRVVRDPALAEAVTQQVFIDAWWSAHEHAGSTSTAASWLLSAAHRHAVDTVRAGTALLTAAAVAVIPSSPVDPAAGRVVREALAQLADPQREAVELAYFGGYTHSEIDLLVAGPTGGACAAIGGGLRRLGVLLDVA